MWNATTAGTNGSDGFFSTIKQGAAVGISEIFGKVLPAWTAAQGKLQASDQLGQTTYVPIGQPVLNNELATTSAILDPRPVSLGLGISVPMALLAVGGILGVGAVLYFATK